MSYADFTLQYPWANLVLELFCKIAPVLVAILAIIINNNQSSKRDKRNKKIDTIIKYENLLIDKISVLQDSLDELLDSLQKVLNCTSGKKIGTICEKYNESKDKVLKSNTELYNLTFCASEILKESVDSKFIAEDIRNLVKSTDNMVINHIDRGVLKSLDDKEKSELENIKNEIDAIKAWLLVDVKIVMEETFLLLK